MRRDVALACGAVVLGVAGVGVWVWRRGSTPDVKPEAPPPYPPVRWEAQPPVYGSGPIVALRRDVHPSLVDAVEAVARETKLPLVVTAGGRTDADARLIYSWGRTVVNPYTGPLAGQPLGAVASNARDATQTPHGYRSDGYAHALDVHPDDTRGARRTTSNYLLVAAAFKRLGFVAGADFGVGGTPDWPHFETRQWRTLAPRKDVA